MVNDRPVISRVLNVTKPAGIVVLRSLGRRRLVPKGPIDLSKYPGYQDVQAQDEIYDLIRRGLLREVVK